MNKIIAVVLCAIGSIIFHPLYAEDITTADGEFYENVKVRKVDPDGIVIIYKDGSAKLYYDNLQEVTKEKYGFDPVKVLRFKQQQKLAQEQQQKREKEAVKSNPELPSHAFIADNYSTFKVLGESLNANIIKLGKPFGYKKDLLFDGMDAFFFSKDGLNIMLLYWRISHKLEIAWFEKKSNDSIDDQTIKRILKANWESNGGIDVNILISSGDKDKVWISPDLMWKAEIKKREGHDCLQLTEAFAQALLGDPNLARNLYNQLNGTQ